MNRNNTVSYALQYGKRLLMEQDIEDAGMVAKLFLCHAASMTTAQLLAEGKRALSEEVQRQYQSMITQRLNGKPAQYILGQWEFMGIPFFVREGVLIPRADTEVLVEAVLEKAEKYGLHNVIDIGTGTGCIPISLAYHGNLKACGVDIHEDALQLAKCNQELNQVSVQWFLSDLFAQVPKEYQGGFDAVISNPPYIRTGDMPHLMREVRDFEPRLALDGGEDGLCFYRRIVSDCLPWLSPKGWLFFEIGYDQGRDVSCLMQKDFTDITIIKDLSGLDRVVLGRRKE